MKKKVFVFTFTLFIVLTLPISSLGTSLKVISTYENESLSMEGPSPPSSSLSDLLSGYAGATEFLMYELLDQVGLAPSDLIGPGGGLTGLQFLGGTYIQSLASGTGMTATGLTDFGDFGEVQEYSQMLMWAIIYQLNGAPGSKADVRLDYSWENFHVNVAADARSESFATAFLGYGISPLGEHTTNAGNFYTHEYWARLLYISTLGFWDTRWFPDSLGLDYEKNYPFAAATGGKDTNSGSLDLGTMEAGDLLYLWGIHRAGTECGVYGPGMCLAAITSNLEFWPKVEDISPPPIPPIESIPEPAAIFLLGTGLAFVAGAARRKRKD